MTETSDMADDALRELVQAVAWMISDWQISEDGDELHGDIAARIVDRVRSHPPTDSRDGALEEAAALCDSRAKVVRFAIAEYGAPGDARYNLEPRAWEDTAKAIRALKPTTTQQPAVTEGWLPIEIAPKDETWIILLFANDSPDPEQVIRGGFWSPDGDWFDSEAASHSLTDYCGQPIAWMPIPKPPVSENPQPQGEK